MITMNTTRSSYLRVALAIFFSFCRAWALDDGLARTPPMGWNSWNHYQLKINESIIRSTADALSTNGMKAAGYQYIIMDAGWKAKERDAQHRLAADPTNFPSGMRALADYVHGKGLKFGLYTDAGARDCVAGTPGSKGFEAMDATTFAEWGIDYLKEDWCNTEGMNAKEAYTLMHNALTKTGRPMVFSVCEWGENQPWNWAPTIAHLWRTTGDIKDCWDCGQDTMSKPGGYPRGWTLILDAQPPLKAYAGPGHWNDPDMLVVGLPGLSLEEARAHFSLWCILAAPLICGCEVTHMSPEIANILLNPEVIAVDQDALGIQGNRVNKEGTAEIWTKPLHDGSQAVVFFNRGDQKALITASFAAQGVSKNSRIRIRDLWRRTDVGTFTNTYSATVGSRAVVMLRATPEPLSTPQYHAPPGRYTTSWVGNSFPGNGGPNGFGYWVQNGADEIEVTPDGTVIAGTDWDEAGRCVGLYKDGAVNRVLLKQEGQEVKETAWGWNTGTHAIATDETNIFVANTGKRLLRFTWTPGDLDSAKVAEEFALPDKVEGLSARHGKLALAYTNRVELRVAKDFALMSVLPRLDVRDVSLAPDGSLWEIAGKCVEHFALPLREVTDSGTAPGVSLCPEVVTPTALAFDNQGRLLVCDDGPDQQIKFYEISGAQPRLVATFGDKGGLRFGVPGLSAPTKLYAPRGAGTDSAGNLYVALGFNGAPVGTLVLRSFTPEGKLRWELANHAFVDTFGFDPDSDGKMVYGRTAVFDLDLDSGNTNCIWRQRATTLDHVTYPKDSRATSGMSVYFRHLQGRRLLYAIGQYGGGFRMFTFEEPEGFLAKPAGRITAPGETWAWDVAPNGDIWHGDFRRGDIEGSFIRHFRFLDWNADGTPQFETNSPDMWPWPEDFMNVRRIIYDATHDALYLSGYLKGEAIDSWGVTGKTLRRYDGWLMGERKARWTLKLPMNPKGNDEGKPLSPNSLAVAGDYLFVGMVKPEEGKQQVHILRLDDGGHVGTFVPGPEAGGNAGWEDMPYAVQALKRKNGEYLVLVEEDWRGKNLLYRWRP